MDQLGLAVFPSDCVGGPSVAFTERVVYKSVESFAVYSALLASVNSDSNAQRLAPFFQEMPV